MTCGHLKELEDALTADGVMGLHPKDGAKEIYK
jgi:hypothetical protein